MNGKNRKIKELGYGFLQPCEHDPDCSHFGWAHDAQLTLDQRLELGLPIEGEVSMAHAKRLMRAYRRGFDAGIQTAEQLLGSPILPKVSVQEDDDAEQ